MDKIEILKTDLEIFNELSDSETGKVIKALLWHLNGRIVDLDDQMTRVVFLSIKNRIDQPITKKRQSNKPFIIPSVDSVKQYCIERKNNVDPVKFINHYSARGWMLGKNKMKDWKAAVRTWEQNDYSSNQKITEENNKATPNAVRELFKKG